MYQLPSIIGVVGWCDGVGKLPVPGRPTIWMIVGQGPIAHAVGTGGGCLDIIFTLLFPFSPLSLSLSGRQPDIDEILSQRAAKQQQQPSIKSSTVYSVSTRGWWQFFVL